MRRRNKDWVNIFSNSCFKTCIQIMESVPMVAVSAAAAAPTLDLGAIPAPKVDKQQMDVLEEPQPWGDPDSPLPEENPDYYEGYVPQHYEQPKPMYIENLLGQISFCLI